MTKDISKPTVGIAMAAYRAADTIGATLEALLAQSMPPARIVVAIDGPAPRKGGVGLFG